MNKFLRLAEKSFIVLGLLSFPAILFVLPNTGIVPNVAITFIKYFVWVVSIILTSIFWKSIIITATRNILIFSLTIIVVFSFLWSELSTVTLQHATDVLMMTLFSLYFATRFNLKEQVQLIACNFLIAGIISTIVSIGFPGVGIDHEFHAGAWHGIYSQKNSLGATMLLSSFTFFALPKENSILYKWFGFSFSLLLVILSTSRTSFVLSFLLISIMMFYKNFRWRGKISVIFINIGILILGCVSVFVLSYWVEIVTSLGRDPTFTGRIPLWSAAIPRLIERPFLGYGLGSFWEPGSRYAIKVGQAMGIGGWVPPNAHNGFVDLGIDVGLIGLSIFLISYFKTFATALKRAYATKNSEALWPLGFLILLAMNNITESYLLSRYSLYWILFNTVVFTMNRKTQTTNNPISKKSYSYVT